MAMNTEPVDDPDTYVLQTEQSEQYAAIMDAVGLYTDELDLQDYTVERLENPEDEFTGVRVELNYDAMLSETGNEASFELHTFYPDDGPMDTTGFLHQDYLLLQEYHVDGEDAANCFVDEYDGHVLLQPQVEDV